MSKASAEETQEEMVESVVVEEVTADPTSANAGEVKAPKRGWFFPNLKEQKPFGGEFETLEEAQAANEKYLKENK